VYGKCAQAQEDAADFEGAVLFWRSSLDSARVAGDRAAEGQACYRIGKAWTQLGDAMRAITFLEDYESISRELEDLEGQGNAFAALSTAYKSLGNDAKALELLNLHLSTATKTMNLVAQAEACSNLAVLYMRQGQHIKAREMLTRNFSITRQVVSGGSPGMTSASVDKARSLLGIASGNAMLKDYVNAMLCNTKGVLDWKCKRTPLSS
jgi:tetratricopeptide (TPR) repeat protein